MLQKSISLKLLLTFALTLIPYLYFRNSNIKKPNLTPVCIQLNPKTTIQKPLYLCLYCYNKDEKITPSYTSITFNNLLSPFRSVLLPKPTHLNCEQSLQMFNYEKIEQFQPNPQLIKTNIKQFLKQSLIKLQLQEIAAIDLLANRLKAQIQPFLDSTSTRIKKQISSFGIFELQYGAQSDEIFPEFNDKQSMKHMSDHVIVFAVICTLFSLLIAYDSNQCTPSLHVVVTVVIGIGFSCWQFQLQADNYLLFWSQALYGCAVLLKIEVNRFIILLALGLRLALWVTSSQQQQLVRILSIIVILAITAYRYSIKYAKISQYILPCLMSIACCIAYFQYSEDYQFEFAVNLLMISSVTILRTIDKQQVEEFQEYVPENAKARVDQQQLNEFKL